MSRIKTQPKEQLTEEQEAQLEIAQYGVDLVSLLWRKALAHSTPEVREMLEAYRLLRSAVEDVFPEEYPTVTHAYDSFYKLVARAEACLTDEPMPKDDQA